MTALYFACNFSWFSERKARSRTSSKMMASFAPRSKVRRGAGNCALVPISSVSGFLNSDFAHSAFPMCEGPKTMRKAYRGTFFSKPRSHSSAT